jgi:magnesium transporter
MATKRKQVIPAKRVRRTGLPPGSLIFTGVQKSDVIVKQMIRYNAVDIEEIDPGVVPESDPNYFYWLDVRGLHNPEEIEQIGTSYGLDPLLLEDILDTSQRPKCELTEHGIFMIMTYLQRRRDSR